jgi:hypothetical protein
LSLPPTSPPPSLWKRFCAWFKDYLGNILLIAGATCSSILGAISAWDKTSLTAGINFLIVVTALVSMFGAYLSVRTRRRYSVLDKKHSALVEAHSLLVDAFKSKEQGLEAQGKDMLRRILLSSNCCSVNVRASLYRHNGSGFDLICRYSQKREFAKKGGPRYDDDYGCLGKAWNDGDSQIDGLPDYYDKSATYISECKRHWGMTKGQVDSLSMKSRNYVGLQISDGKGETNAVLIVESMEPAELITTKIKDSLNRDLNAIRAFIASHEHIFTTPTSEEQDRHD